MYKMITRCSNCGTYFISEKTYNKCDIALHFQCSIHGHGEHECIGGEIGMKVFRCFREVKE